MCECGYAIMCDISTTHHYCVIMASGKTCGKCEFFLKVQWNDKPGSLVYGRNGICEKYDYNAVSDSTYAQQCKGYKHKQYKRGNEASNFLTERR